MRAKIILKLISNLLGKPISYISFFAGSTSLLLGWGVGSTKAVFIGVCSYLICAGYILSKLILDNESLTEKAVSTLNAIEIQSIQERIEELIRELHRDRDKRTHTMLRNLSQQYFDFKNTIAGKGLNAIQLDVVANIEELFEICVDELAQSLKLYQDMLNMKRGAAKTRLEKKRNEIVEQVVDIGEQLTTTIVNFHLLEDENDSRQDRIDRLRSELDSNLEVAKKTQERLATITGISKSEKPEKSEKKRTKPRRKRA